MQRIGLIGGLGPESTALYYRLLNQGVRARRGRLHGARVLVDSLDLQELVAAQEAGDEGAEAALVCASGARLARAGADFLVIACNTVHRFADAVAEAAGLPLLHVADVAGRALAGAGVARVGLLGTRATMEGEFYRKRLEAGFGPAVLVPPAEGRAALHRAILEELASGAVRAGTRALGERLLRALRDEGAEAALLACSELVLLFPEAAHAGAAVAGVPLFDTTTLHAAAAVERALADA